MIPFDPVICKDFLKEISNCNKNSDAFSEILKLKYLESGLEFHRLFLRSKIALDMPIDRIKRLYHDVEVLNQDIRTIISTDFAFMIHILNQQSLYENQILDNLENSKKRIYVEDLLLYIEYVTKLIKNGQPFLGHPNINKISSSQLDHLHDSFEIIIEYVNKHHVLFSYKAPSSVKEECGRIFNSAAFLMSAKSCFEEHSYQMYVPYLAEEFWYLKQNPEYWARMEKYRDLNSIYQDKKESSFEEEKGIAQEVGAMQIYGDNEILYLDASKEKEYQVSMELHKRYKRMETVFGEPDVKFDYCGKSYKIKDLLRLYEAIYLYILKKWEDEEVDVENRDLIRIIGRKSFLRTIGMSGSTEAELLDLLAYDFERDSEKHYLVHDKPLLKKDELFFLLPSKFFNIALERMMDKILTNQVVVNFSEKKGSDLKGFVFENNLEEFFKSNGFLFGKVPRNENRGIPEIDGIFLMDDHVFIYEAKASIPPNSMVDAHNLLKDTLLKAKYQLDIRMKLLLNNDVARAYIEQKSGIQFGNRKISPFILVNHRTFAGYKELKGSSVDSHFPVVCFDDLKDILICRKIPVWNYCNEKDNYKRSIKSLNNGEALWDFMLDQFSNLETMEKPIVSASDIGVAYQIVRPTSI